jgi:hypothetical protein
MVSLSIKLFLILICIIVVYLLYNSSYVIEGNDGLDIQSACPDPIYATDPDSNIVDNLLINDFMAYMDNKIQQVNSDLDRIGTLISRTSFNIIIDPDIIPEVEIDKPLPPPVIKKDSSNPPNYGIIFKLPKGRVGKIGDTGDDGVTGPIGPTGSVGPDGSTGKRIVLL